MILNFLGECFDRGLEHSTIGGYRSAISAFHEPIEGFKVGQHPDVSALMAGVYNQRFPKPKYTFIWDVEIVVKFLISMGNNKDLDDKALYIEADNVIRSNFSLEST